MMALYEMCCQACGRPWEDPRDGQAIWSCPIVRFDGEIERLTRLGFFDCAAEACLGTCRPRPSAAVSGHGFRPYYNRGLGVTVTSAAHQDRVAKELGVVHVGREGGD